MIPIQSEFGPASNSQTGERIRLRDRAQVTGASRGIGKACVRRAQDEFDVQMGVPNDHRNAKIL